MRLDSDVTQIPFFDLRRQFARLRSDLMAELAAVCDEQSFVLGPWVQAFENQVKAVTGTLHAFGVSSGTDAELLILMSLGLGPGEAVITTPLSFFSTAGCIARVGARPIFVDIDPQTLNLSADALEDFLTCRCILTSRGLMTDGGMRVRAVIPVHLFGLCADLDRLRNLCDRYGIALVEDAAQAIGAVYPGRSGRRLAGSVGDAGFFSFYPTKNLGAFGDAGLAVTSDDEMADKLRIGRNHGMDPRYYHHTIGGNFRMDALQAAVLSRKLRDLERWSTRRWQIAQRYREVLAPIEGRFLQLPAEPYRGILGACGHIYHQFVVRSPKRDALRAFLTERGIGTEVYYPVALHRQPCFASLGYQSGDLPVAEQAAGEVLALPIFPELTEEEVECVAQTVCSFFSDL
ncbi:MAG: DegT/DnrJ/EryC1/StrS family aminotransferase [Verrucomicrobia bacterium]|nr:DegT/DnrJ/EryC1/StrS family aminotransferase [Verrucomicrobiota bacterium]